MGHEICKRESIRGDEYYTLNVHARDIIYNLDLPKWGGVVWCPFDKEDSEIVMALIEDGYDVVHTHIDDGHDFFNTEPPANCMAIVSNPPFSIKKEVLQRIKDLDIKFALILQLFL